MMPPDASAPLDFAAFATGWRGDGISKLLGFVWAGYDALRRENPPTLNPRDEIGVNSHLESWIHRKMPKNCPFDIQHTPPELSRRRTSSRPPPAPDFGFFPRTDRRVMFPLEAKVLQTEGNLSEYLKALRTRFLQCRYAPHSSEGTMIGYLLSGDDEITFRKLKSKLRTNLEVHPDFLLRPHRVSHHLRKHKRCKNSPATFCCHHLLMAFS
jgi:hypothetical protein